MKNPKLRHSSVDTAISIGKSVLGALFSRKKLSRTNVDRAYRPLDARGELLANERMSSGQEINSIRS